MREELFVKIDSHAHLTSDELYPDIEEIIARAKEAGVNKVVNINTDRKTLQRALELQKKHPDFLFNTGATTPHDVEKEGDEMFEDFVGVAKNRKLVAIGETGLDYYYEHSDRACQKKFLQKYLDLAKSVNLPVVIHCRGDEAFADLFAITKEASLTKPCLLHCFTGTFSQAKIALERGWSISISGIVTFKKSEELRQVVKEIPLESLLIETDSPYLAPQSKRGRVNEPAFVGEVAETIAMVKHLDLSFVTDACTQNTRTFFGI